MLSFYGIIKFVKYAINVESKPPENITAIFESLFVKKWGYLEPYPIKTGGGGSTPYRGAL